jgi:hypothetical protein
MDCLHTNSPQRRKELKVYLRGTTPASGLEPTENDIRVFTCKISRDGNQFQNTINAPVAIPSGLGPTGSGVEVGWFTLTLTAAEMNCQTLLLAVKFVSSYHPTPNSVFALIKTFGAE